MKTMNDVYEKLAKVGVSKEYIIKYVMPLWWSDEADEDCFTYGLATIARRLNLEMDSLLYDGDEPIKKWNDCYANMDTEMVIKINHDLMNFTKDINRNFLRFAYKFDTDSEVDKDILYDMWAAHIGSLFSAKLFEECDELLKMVDVDQISAAFITIMFRSTYAEKRKLPYREVLLNDKKIIAKMIESRGEEGAKQFFKGL